VGRNCWWYCDYY